MPAKQKSHQSRRSRRERAAGGAVQAKSPSDLSPSPTPVTSNRSRNLQYCVLLAVVTVILYSSLGSHPFLNYDDESYVSKNAHVQSGLTWDTIAWAFTSTDLANWHPVTWLSHALDVQIFGDWAGGHHLMSLALHAVNVILLYLLLARFTGYAGRSLFVAALFAVHPINVESVAWVAERKNVLSTLFFLLALGAYGRYAQKPSALGYLSVAGFFALGLASKPMLVTFPFVLLLLDYWPLRRIQGWTEPLPAFSVQQKTWPVLLYEKVPLLVLSALSCAITVIAQTPTAVAASSDLPVSTRIGSAIYAYAMYVLKAFWPAGLAPIYPHPGNTLTPFQITFAAVFLLLVSIGVWHYRRAHPFLLVGWLWFLGTLVPVIGLVQVGVQSMADRYAYIPFVGIFVMFVWSVAELAEAPKFAAAFNAGAFIIVGILFIIAWEQVQYWMTPQDLWSHTLKVTKDNYVAEDNLGTALLRMGNVEALKHFQNATRISPNDPISHGALAGYLQDQGKFQEAISYYQVALQNNSDPEILAVTEANLAVLYRQTGDYEKARDTYRQAVKSNPQALNEMFRDLSKQLASRPAAVGYLRMGLLLDVANRLPEARAAYLQALQLNPGLQDAQKALATLR